jgi:trigger factor
MQVSVESTSELGRKMTVHVPEEKIQVEVASRLKNLAGKVKIDGFRPGKVPASVIQKRYGQGVREEVLADLVQSTFYEAVRAEKLNPAGGPTITPQSAENSEGFSYVADFEVVPEIQLTPVDSLSVNRFVSEVTDEDLDNMVEKLRDQRKTWRQCDGRPAAMGDRLLISFEGTCDGENFTNGRVEDFGVVLGSNQLIPGFEEKLVGVTAGSDCQFSIDFPSDYGNINLAGKSAEFSVSVAKIEEPVLPAIDQEFVNSFGIESGSADDFRADIKANMEREMTRALQAKTKTSVMDELYSRHADMLIPGVLVQQEISELIKPYVESAKKAKQPIDQASLSERLTPVAKRRVALAMILGRLIDSERIKVDSKRVRAAIDDLSLSYEDPSQVVNWYYSNKEQLSQVENMVLEDQVVDAVLAKAQVSEESVLFKDLMQPQQ